MAAFLTPDRLRHHVQQVHLGLAPYRLLQAYIDVKDPAGAMNLDIKDLPGITNVSFKGPPGTGTSMLRTFWSKQMSMSTTL